MALPSWAPSSTSCSLNDQPAGSASGCVMCQHGAGVADVLFVVALLAS